MMMTFREGLHQILPMSIVTPNYGEKICRRRGLLGREVIYFPGFTLLKVIFHKTKDEDQICTAVIV